MESSKARDKRVGRGHQPCAAARGAAGCTQRLTRMSSTAEGSDEAATTQTLLFARDLARLQRLRRQYEQLLPARLDPDAMAPAAPLVRDAVVLFTDLRGFTRLVERFDDDPTGLLNVVNEHMSVIVAALLRCGGVIEKFVGDGVFATFGARSDLDHPAAAAVASALACVGATAVLNRRRSADWGFQLEVAVGVASGPVVIGQIGPPARAEFGVLGDAVNVASRLSSTAAASEVLLTMRVHHALGGNVQAELLGSQAVRGRAGAIELYRIALRRPAGPAPAPERARG